MIRKLVLSAVAITGTLTGLALTPTVADARPPIEYTRHRFEVLVHRGGAGWRVRNVFHNRFDAERDARRLRVEGFRVEIREL